MSDATALAELGTNGTAGAERIRAAFARARDLGRVALVPYIVAGYPDQATAFAAALTVIDAGADLLEIGLPYSDPLADGATLQRASSVALAAGATFDRSTSLIAEVHAARPRTPLVAMAYANQALGADDGRHALARLAEAGVSGVILADLTPDEGDAIEASAREAGVALVYLVTPTTNSRRRASVAQRSGGFVYAVSLVGVTGARARLAADVLGFVRATRRDSPVPVAVGFGVSSAAHVRRLARAADGVIVASALVDAMGRDGRDVAALGAFVRDLHAATHVAFSAAA